MPGPERSTVEGGAGRMSFPKSDKIWMNGKLVPWDDAKIHVASHVIHYGSAVFEGVRCYATPDGPAGFPPEPPTEPVSKSAQSHLKTLPSPPAGSEQRSLRNN